MLVFRRSFWRIRLQPRALGAAGLCLARRVRADRSRRRAEHRPDLCGRAGRRRGARLWRGAGTALDARDSLLHRGDGADTALCARQIHAGVSLIYDFVPGVTFYRRPADATFVFCALLALLARLSRAPVADRHRPAAAPMAARCRDCRSPWRSSGSPSAWRYGSARCKAPRCRSCGASDLSPAAIAVLVLARRVAGAQRACGGGIAGRLQRRRSRLEQRAERVDRAEAFAIRGAASGHRRTKPSRC